MKSQNNRETKLRKFFVIYFIVAYIIMMVLFIQASRDIINMPLQDKWEKAECPQVRDHRFLNTECEKHISISIGNKILGVVMLLGLCLIIPVLVLICLLLICSTIIGRTFSDDI